MSSSWNTHFHKNQAYDTSYNNNEQGISMPQPQNFSSFPYEHVQDHENDNINNNMSDKRQSFSNKVEINEDSSASLLSTSPRQSVTNTGVAVEKNKDLIMSPVSLQFQDPRGPTQQRETYNRQSESDEELARRLHREETESYHRDIMGSGGQVGGLYSPQGEAAAYYSTMGDQGQTVSGAPVQGTATDIKRNSKIPKAYSNPLVTVQLEKMEKRRLSRWRKPYFTWIVTIIQLALFIAEFIKNKELYGTAIQTTPFNPMIGPSALTLIQLGARFNPCMRTVKLPDSFAFECPPKLQEELHTQTCSLETICGFNGFKDGVTPDQWFRFITPIFVHAGVIHFLFNMLFQLITGSSVEVDIGSWRYGIIYMASGIFGFIFGGNFAEPTIPSMGASGALFGIIGILLIDIFQNWRLILNPCWKLTKLLLMIVISFLIGLLPGLDNFSHIGGFLMGILTGLILLRSIDFSKFHKWATWILRIAAIPIAVLLYFFLIQNFYSNDPREKCPWCKYLSCLPVLGWCDETGLRTN